MGQAGASAGTGAATGAASGALAGSAILPGIGTAVGAVAGGIIGGVSGYLSGSGADAKAKRLEKARKQYEEALLRHDTLSAAAANGYRGSVTELLAGNQQAFQDYLQQMPGDQTNTLHQDVSNQQAALSAAPSTAAPLSGPLGAQYGAEAQGRVNTAIAPLALNYGAEQQGQSFLANDRRLALNRAGIAQQGAVNEQRYGLGQAERDADLQRAQANYATQTGDAQSAGDDRIMYGALLQQGLNLSAQGAMAFGGHSNTPALQRTTPMGNQASDYTGPAMRNWQNAQLPGNDPSYYSSSWGR